MRRQVCFLWRPCHAGAAPIAATRAAAAAADAHGPTDPARAQAPDPRLLRLLRRAQCNLRSARRLRLVVGPCAEWQPLVGPQG